MYKRQTLGYTVLVKGDWLTPMQLVAKMSTNPDKLLGIEKGDISVGKAADITVIDPEKEYVIDAKNFASMGKNTPFDGWRVQGKVEYTLVDGKMKVKEGVLQ